MAQEMANIRRREEGEIVRLTFVCVVAAEQRFNDLKRPDDITSVSLLAKLCLC